MKISLRVLLVGYAISQAAVLAIAQSVPDPNEAMSIAAIQAERDALISADLLEGTKTTAIESYNRAIEAVEAANVYRRNILTLSAESTKIREDLTSFQSELSQHNSPRVQDAKEFDGMALEELRTRQRTAESKHETLSQQLQQLTAELDRRELRLRDLPRLVQDCKTELEAIKVQSETISATDENPIVRQAPQVLLDARRLNKTMEFAFLEKELTVYESNRELNSQKRDALDQLVRQQTQTVETLRIALADKERAAARRQQEDAAREAENAHPAVRSAAAVNTALAKTNSDIVTRLESARKNTTDSNTLETKWAQRISESRQQAEAGKFSHGIGLLLRSELSDLPETSQLREQSRIRVQEIAELTLQTMRWEQERRKLIDVDMAVTQEMSNKVDDFKIDEADREKVASEYRNIVSGRLNLYRDLVSNGQSLVTELTKLEAAQGKFANSIETYRSFILEHILWITSAPPVSASIFVDALIAAPVVLDQRPLISIAGRLWNDFRVHPFRVMPPLLFAGWLFLLRRRLKERLLHFGTIATRSSTTTFQPTLSSLLITFFLAIPFSIMIACVGWRLRTATPLDSVEYALGTTLLMVAVVVALMRFAIAICQPNGLGELHFEWRDNSRRMIARAANWILWLALPFGGIVAFSEIVQDELLTSSVGRIAFCISLVGVGIAATRFGWPVGFGKIFSSLSLAFEFLRRQWASLALLATLFSLGIASLSGYHYAATHLSEKLLTSFFVIAALILLRALIVRWLLLTYRRAAIQRHRERLETLAKARELASDAEGDAASVIEAESEVRLSDINQLAQRFVHLITGCLGATALLLIWYSSVPTLGLIFRYQLWVNSVTGVVDGVEDRVTVGALCLGVIVLVLTAISCRSIPALLNITILQRLPVDAGIRYAAAAITRYVLVIAGTILAFRQFGIGWSSIQWLVAAMTVGLGFGLQEIFANFVSGMILLFERPARVGDTVTIGNVTGTVTKIRIRATTILDWDNKELIVPNKEFITGNLVNWTLTNPNLRVVLKVGIAYGSNTRLATKLLYQVARENPQVLDDPEAVVVFHGFGESCLDFELRLFVAGQAAYRRLRHELNLAIDDLFREHNVEIAFPQRDLHIRTVSETLPALRTQAIPAQLDANNAIVTRN